MYTVKIRLRKPRRVFTFLSSDVTLMRDEPCIVQSDRGTEWGTCILPPEPCPKEMERRYSMRVVRRVDQADRATQQFLEEEERKARALCLGKIHERKLPMKLVDAEYTFDKRKMVFYFTAEDRVDFRELVRDLAHELRTRIELRHIQVRDEAKMVGGIGGCGRELCCTTWLNEFKPISMRMAKRQNLSLNPGKISGQCGRLLCCLSYENDQYETMKRRAKQAPAPQDGDAPARKPDDSRDRPRRDRAEAAGDERKPRQDGQKRPQAPRPAGNRPPQRKRGRGAGAKPGERG